jgi:hypothetical protein
MYVVCKTWAQYINEKYHQGLKEIEEMLDMFLVDRPVGSLSMEDENSSSLLNFFLELLAMEEAKWNLKSWAIWLKEGENNTNFFKGMHKIVRI